MWVFIKITKYGNFCVSLRKIKHFTLMEIVFKDVALSELFETGKTKDRKYKKLCKNKKLVDGYIRAVSIMYRTETTRELSEYSFCITKSWRMIQEARLGL